MPAWGRKGEAPCPRTCLPSRLSPVPSPPLVWSGPPALPTREEQPDSAQMDPSLPMGPLKFPP